MYVRLSLSLYIYIYIYIYITNPRRMGFPPRWSCRSAAPSTATAWTTPRSRRPAPRAQVLYFLIRDHVRSSSLFHWCPWIREISYREPFGEKTAKKRKPTRAPAPAPRCGRLSSCWYIRRPPRPDKLMLHMGRHYLNIFANTYRNGPAKHTNNKLLFPEGCTTTTSPGAEVASLRRFRDSVLEIRACLSTPPPHDDVDPLPFGLLSLL